MLDGSPTYQWRRDGVFLTTPSPPDIFSFSSLRQADSGEYTCTVTNGSVTATSNSVNLTVQGKWGVVIICCTCHMPCLSLVPAISVVVSGSPAAPTEGAQYTLTCTVSGHENLMASVTYEWLNNSNIVQGQTNNRFIFNPVDRYDNGTYTCRVIINSPLLNSSIMRQGTTTLSVSGKKISS